MGQSPGTMTRSRNKAAQAANSDVDSRGLGPCSWEEAFGEAVDASLGWGMNLRIANYQRLAISWPHLRNKVFPGGNSLQTLAQHGAEP